MLLGPHVEGQQVLDGNVSSGLGLRPKHNVIITFDRPDLQPPVYVASSISSPPWQPYEMSFIPRNSANTSDPAQLHFFKEFKDVEVGQYQYKFRLGPGDWWILDDKAETVLDPDGNTNNLLVVQPETYPDSDQLRSTTGLIDTQVHCLPTMKSQPKSEIYGLDGAVKMDNVQQEPVSDDISTTTPSTQSEDSDAIFIPQSAPVDAITRSGGLSESSINIWFPINREDAHLDSDPTPISVHTRTHKTPDDNVSETHTNAESFSAFQSWTDNSNKPTEARENIKSINLVALKEERDKVPENTPAATSHSAGSTLSAITGIAIAEVPDPAAVSTENHSNAVHKNDTGNRTEIPKLADVCRSDNNSNAAPLSDSRHAIATSADEVTTLDQSVLRELVPVESGSGVATTIARTATKLDNIGHNELGHVISEETATNGSTADADVTTQVEKDHLVTPDMNGQPAETNAQYAGLEPTKDRSSRTEEPRELDKSNGNVKPPSDMVHGMIANVAVEKDTERCEHGTTYSSPVIHDREPEKSPAGEQQSDSEQYPSVQQHEEAASPLAFEPVEESDAELVKASGNAEATVEGPAWIEIFGRFLAFIIGGWLAPVIKWLARLGGRD